MGCTVQSGLEDAEILVSSNRYLTEEQAYDLLAYLIASSETSLEEPAFYGPRRLLEAAERLSVAMLGDANDDAWLRSFASEVETGMSLARKDPEAFASLIRKSSAGIAAELLRRADLPTQADDDPT